MPILIRILIRKNKDRDRNFESNYSHYSFVFISWENLEGFLTIKGLKDPDKFYSEEFLRLIHDSVQIFNWIESRESYQDSLWILFRFLIEFWTRLYQDIRKITTTFKLRIAQEILNFWNKCIATEFQDADGFRWGYYQDRVQILFWASC